MPEPVDYDVASRSPAQPLVVALAGNPNSGKTTLFNAITGLRQKVANYPGVTVEKKVGKARLPDGRVLDVIDLPGAYSLVSRSPDEQVTMQVLRGLRPDTPAPEVVIAVVDASNLQRNLYLLSQLIELGRPIVVALNMMDITRRRGLHIFPERLSEQLGVPVIPIVAHKKEGVRELLAAIGTARPAPLPLFRLPEPMLHAIGEVASALEQAGHTINARVIAERLLVDDHAQDAQSYMNSASVRAAVEQARARLLALDIDPMQADIEAHYRWIEGVTANCLEPASVAIDVGMVLSEDRDRSRPLDYALPMPMTDRIDRVLLHKIWGLLAFCAIMTVLFVSIFIVADPLMGATEGAVKWIGGLLAGLLPQGPLRDLWSDGIVSGVGGVLVFVPQIAVLFLFLAILEDSGYLARAAFLMDRALGKLGLNGKSFIPLLSSFACAIPGIMATRTIENRRDRLATIFVAPFMSCSARLPVYGLLIGAFFASFSPFVRGGIMFACYALGVLAAVATALVFRKTFLKSARSSFVLELPSYKLPQIGQILRVMLTNTWMFIRRAGTIIFCLSVVLWAMAYYPRLSPAEHARISEEIRQKHPKSVSQHEAIRDIIRANLEINDGLQATWLLPSTPSPEEADAEVERALAAAQLEQSISGRLGHFIEPVIKPLGYDWKMGVGLIASFAAREVFVSQMGIVYSAGEVEEDQSTLEQAMLADRYPDGKPVWTAPVAISLLVWFVLAMQCMSTVAIVRRETNSWTWAIGQLVYMNVLAYLGALIAYQVCVSLI